MSEHYYQRTPTKYTQSELISLNDKFASYTDRVRALKEQCKSSENNTFIAHTNALENEIQDLQRIYEEKKNQLENDLEQVTIEKNSVELKANKLEAQNSEISNKLGEETTNRKKLENALADAHRLLSEKDSCIQDCRITIAQVQNALVEVQKDRDDLRSGFTQSQITAETEAKARKDLEAQCTKLNDELNFRQQISEKEMMELSNKLLAAERAIELADEELKKHEDVDDNLANMIAKIRIDTQHEIQRYQQEAETNYQQSIADCRNKLDQEIKRRSQSEEETIQVKAIIEELNAKNAKLDSKAVSVEDQNNSLIRTLQAERQSASNAIRELEGKVNELHQKLHENRQELTATQNSIIPFDTELQGFHSLLDAEEKRLQILLSNQPSELQRTSTGELYSTRTPYTGRRSKPGSPKHSAKPRSEDDSVKLPPLKNNSARTGSPKYEAPKMYNKYNTQGKDVFPA